MNGNDICDKNCLLVFRNKRINDFEAAEKVINICALHGYCFEKVSFVSYSNAQEVANALKDGTANYSNLAILCPESMVKTIKAFESEQLGAEFDGVDILNGQPSVFMLVYGDKLQEKTENLCDFLNNKYGKTYNSAFVKTVGAPASKINSAVERAMRECGDLIINVTDSYGDCTIEIVYDSITPKTAFDNAYRELVAVLQEYVYALENVTLAQRLVDLLKLRRRKISIAESFTGGGVGKRLVDISGVSEVYFEGLNTYSNEAKAARLGVDDYTLKRYGAVSSETARQMTEGLLSTGNCSVAIATTGIAGPKSDNTKKPVGLAYIGVGIDEEISVYEFNLKGSRQSITETAINLALFLTYKS